VLVHQPAKTMTANNTVSGAFERSNPEVCARPAFSADHAGSRAAIIALFDNRQALAGTKSDSVPILLHRAP
jgi:hypothetical protein